MVTGNSFLGGAFTGLEEEALAPITKEEARPFFDTGSLLSEGAFRPSPLSTNLINTGQPTTVQEKDWLLNYFEQTGRLPTLEESGRWRASQGFGQIDPFGRKGAPVQEFLPGSTQFKQGFRTSREADLARFYGSEFGPAAENLPEGSRLIFSTQGRAPYVATPDLLFGGGPSQGAVERGLAGAPSDFPSPVARQEFQQPEFQELLDRELNPIEQYVIRAEDYFNQQMEQELETLRQQYLGGVDAQGKPVSPQQQLLQQQQFQQLSAEVELRYDQERERTIGEAQSGVPVEQLPFFQESLNLTGGLLEWYNQRIPQLSQEFLAQSPDFVEGIRDGRRTGEFFPDRPAANLGGATPEEIQPQGDPFAQYIAYSQSLGLAQPALEWMQDNFGKLHRLWQATGQPNFIRWVQRYLAAGGK